MKSLLSLAMSACMAGFAVAQLPAPLEVPTVEFATVEEAAGVLAGPPDDLFFARLYPREAAAMTGAPRGDKTIEESREAARAVFADSALAFTQEEEAGLRAAVERLHRKFGALYPQLINRPWKIVKTKPDLCGGFSFTRGHSIVLAESTIERMLKPGPTETERKMAELRLESLLVHEQMHVLQRADPNHFLPLYKSVFHFRPANVNVHPWIDERQVTNPDGVDDNWLVETSGDDGQKTRWWIGTILSGEKELHVMGKDFLSVAVPLEELDDDTWKMVTNDDGVPAWQSLEEVREFTSRLPIPGGYDHPNEVAAYTLMRITHPRRLPEGESLSVLKATGKWFAQNLNPDAEKEEEVDEGKAGTPTGH